MTRQISPYGFGIVLDLPFDQLVERTKAELAKAGFGVLTEIDVSATFSKKLNVTFPPYLILGACNPELAHRALTTDLQIGLLLPCNVIVYATSRDGRNGVSIMDPTIAFELSGNDQLREVAAEVRARLERVIDNLAASAQISVSA